MDAVFYRDSRNRLSSVLAQGHVVIEQTSSDRYSLVCASVSGILQAARLGLEEHVRIPIEAHQAPGELRLRWPAAARDDERVIAIMETARLALLQIAQQYPLDVRVRDEPEP